MGILYDTVMEQKRKFLIDRLTESKVLVSQSGKSIRELGYEELKYELVLVSFREIDTDKAENTWFRKEN